MVMTNTHGVVAGYCEDPRRVELTFGFPSHFLVTPSRSWFPANWSEVNPFVRTKFDCIRYDNKYTWVVAGYLVTVCDALS